uniref:Uncharacterized protein n=1 Tax=Rhizophora mucronata TaxID=61149 RepID=A0A2P2QWS1_RHIMU
MEGMFLKFIWTDLLLFIAPEILLQDA